MKQNLATKYRPKRFDEITEQNSIKQILSEELKTNRISRVLLFTGGAGTGKTTSARIYANEIEPISSNIFEINCADKTGVDDVRDYIIAPSKIKPLQGKYKIFILDESHQLTVQSQNALLKILEEPPSYCVFIMCTTDPQKVLPTILSRAVRYDFQLISYEGIFNRLLYVLNSEKNDPNGCGVQNWDNEAISYIAQNAAGHMRNALVLLEKVISYSKNITIEDVVNVLGVTSYTELFNVLDSILKKDQLQLLSSLDKVEKSGMDLKLFTKNLLSFTLDINKYIIQRENNSNNIMLNIPPTYSAKLNEYLPVHKPILKHLLTTLLELNSSLRWETNVRPVIETNLLLEIL